MKFWKKLVLFIVAVISIILSISRYFVVRNNFEHSIENAVHQNTNQHSLEKYALESFLVKCIQEGKEVSEEELVEYLKSMYNYMNDESELVGLFGEDYQNIYANVKKLASYDIQFMTKRDSDTYALRKVGDKRYLLFASKWLINGRQIYLINGYDVNDLYRERDRQKREILIADILILAVSSVMVAIFSIYLTRPIKELNRSSKKIAYGKFNERVRISSGDEIGELADNFNLMADQVENRINALHTLVKQKDDFINGFTHELKTPMTAIMGYADILRLKQCDEELSKKALNYIYRESKRLERLSFQLMKLMSLTEEKIVLEPVEISGFVERIAKFEEIAVSQIELELDLDKEYVLCEKELLEVVIRNLIENAFKSEPKDCMVHVTGRRLSGGTYKISVIDNGKGIPKEHIERVTEDFYMVDKSRSRESGGSGIGLSLVKKILSCHGAELHIKSVEEIGTTVSFELEVESRSEKEE